MKSYNVSDVIAAKAYLSEKSAELQPGLPKNVALKPSHLHLFLEILQKLIAFSSFFIYY